MKVNGSMIKLMKKEFILTKMMLSIKENGKIIGNMDFTLKHYQQDSNEYLKFMEDDLRKETKLCNEDWLAETL
jgi:fructose-1,6-bisphosphatase